jgi:hypothetical protein
MFTANKLRHVLSKVMGATAQITEQSLIGKCLTTHPRIGGVMIINSYKPSARFSSSPQDAAPTMGDRIHALIMTEEIAEFLQKEGNGLSKEDLVLVLEQLAGSSDRK